MILKPRRDPKWRPSRTPQAESYCSVSYSHQHIRVFRSQKGRDTWQRRISKILKEKVDLSNATFDIVQLQPIITFEHNGRKYRLYKAGESVNVSTYHLQKYKNQST